MKGNFFKVVMFFMCLVALFAATRSFAQGDNASDEQADEQDREAQTQQTLNQIHDLALKMKEAGNRLDVLEKTIDQNIGAGASASTEVKEVTTEPVPVEQIPAEEIPSPASSAQLALADTAPAVRSIPERETVMVETPPPAPAYYAPSTELPKEHIFEISEEDSYSNFKEDGNNRKGPYFGINLAYTFRPLETENWPVNVYHLDLRGDYGILNYNDGQGDKLRNIKNYMIEPRAWVGKDFDFGPMAKLTPYMGVGYRWNYEETNNKMVIDFFDDSGNTLEIKPNNKQTQYIYIPVGGILSVHPAEGWRVDLNAEYDYLVWGRATFYSPQATFDGMPLTTQSTNNTLKHGFGLRGSIKFVKEEDVVNYFVEPYIRYWDIGASKEASLIADNVDTGITTQEEKNHSTEIGARLGVEF